MSTYQIEKANKDLFAVYQTIYSQADVEMWFSWNDRLNDTKWSEDCYFVYCNGEKIGGAIVADGLVMFAFLVPPFCDRYSFWKLILNQAKQNTTGSEIAFNGVLAVDLPFLQNLGVRIRRARQIMCRPTDSLPYTLPSDYTVDAMTESDIDELADVQHQSYLQGISYEIFGIDDLDLIKKVMQQSLERYRETDTLDQCIVVRYRNKIVGGCIAGVNPKMPNLFAGIDEVFVVPKHRGKGIGEAMLKHTLTKAFAKAPVMKLHVLVANPAASLYHKLGFIAGPIFTDMQYSQS